jgi:hypothetical protein
VIYRPHEVPYTIVQGSKSMKAIEMRRWTREEYDKMIAAGMFAPGEHVELIDGDILQTTPQGSAHFTAIRARNLTAPANGSSPAITSCRSQPPRL